MNPTNESGGRVLEAFNRLAEFKRMEGRMWFLIEAISLKVDSRDNGDLQAMCAEALPLWKVYESFLRRGREEFGLDPKATRSPQADAMMHMILESGAAGCSVGEIRRRQDELWSAVDAESAAQATAGEEREGRAENVQ